ncbi:MAG: outer membrane protein assembly factor BamA [Rhodospirillales bacterium]|nr:outer membrane protein assembly factor BamA [Rhodospirillales bacterium]
MHAAHAQSGGVVRNVIVEGAQRVDPATVRSYLLLRSGDTFDPARIDRSLKSLFATGIFADVSLQRNGDDLIVTVIENPVINRIAFEGNDKFTDDALNEEMNLRPRVIYTRTKVQKDVKRMLTLYRQSGRFAAVIEPKLIKLEQNRVDIVFEINEGKPTDIQNIRIVGNTKFKDSRLRQVIQTEETRWGRFLSSTTSYDPDRLTLDRELLRRFYLKNGYADFRVISALAELTPDRRNFFITFTVEEGERYKFGKIDVDTRLRDLKPEQVKQVIEIEPGAWYDSTKIDKGVNRITSQVGTLGYAFVEVRPRVRRDQKTKTISIKYEINEGPRVFVERIDVSGNVRTLDKVIRREFKLVEGDGFNAAKMRRSRQRLQNLNFFEKVAVEQVPGSAPDKNIIKVSVEEKSTGSVSFGAGYSSTNGPLADVGLEEKNFLGRGQLVKFNIVIAAEKSQVDIGFREPYFLGREITAGVDIFRTRTDRQDTSSLDTDEYGASTLFSYPILESLSQRWGYSVKQTKITDVSSNASQVIIDAQNDNKKRLISEIRHTLRLEKRDNIVNPTDGYTVGFTTAYAGLGGDATFVRNSLSGKYFYPVADQWVFSLVGSAGWAIGVGEEVSFLDRLFLGGSKVRGFDSAGIGPRDNVKGDALGAEWVYSGQIELDFPVGLPDSFRVTGKVFTDFGSAGGIEEANPNGSSIDKSSSFRASVGFGFQWVSPFGPVGLDFAVPYLKEEFDQTEFVRFNFGARL